MNVQTNRETRGARREILFEGSEGAQTEAWPEAVDGAELLNELSGLLER